MKLLNFEVPKRIIQLMADLFFKRAGWRGEPDAHAEAGRLGGQATAKRYGSRHFAKIGRKGGKAK